MKINKLQIGNYVMGRYSNDIFIIDSINKQTIGIGNDLIVSINMIKPIPLTDKLINDLGFKVLDTYFIYYVFIPFYFELRIRKEGDSYKLRMKRNNSKILLREIKYVHTLQNIINDLEDEE